MRMLISSLCPHQPSRFRDLFAEGVLEEVGNYLLRKVGEENGVLANLLEVLLQLCASLFSFHR